MKTNPLLSPSRTLLLTMLGVGLFSAACAIGGGEATPESEPSSEPSASPGSEPSASPGSEPSASPGSEPSASPGSEPSASPGSEPSASPGSEPSATPEPSPTTEPEPTTNFDICELETTDALGGVTSRISYTYTYNSDGHRVETFIDYNGDGVVDVMTLGTHDGSKRLLTSQSDNDVDGIYDSTSTYFYPDVTTIHYERFETVSAAGTSTTYFTWDAGRVMVQETDNDSNGTIDMRLENFYDDAGHLIRTEIDSDNDGTVDSTSVTTVVVTGNVTVESRDTDNDGDIDTTTTTTKDADGRILGFVLEIVTAVGNYLYDYSYTYDGAGRILRVDVLLDGALESVSTYDYSCHG